jgi:hypothetical protein
MSLVGSSTSKSKLRRRTPRRRSGRRAPTRGSRRARWPPTGRGGGSRGRRPAILTASSHSGDCTPRLGLPVELHERRFARALTSRKVCTPKPSIMRSERGMVRSDIAHMSMWVALGHERDEVPEGVVRRGGLREAAVGSIFTECTRSGNLIASWMKKTGMLLPTRSQLPSSGVELHREAAHVAGVSTEPAPPATVEKRTNTGVVRPVLEEGRLGQGAAARRARSSRARRAARVDDALGDALVVEVGDLLAEDEVLEQRRAARARAWEGVLVVGRDPSEPTLPSRAITRLESGTPRIRGNPSRSFSASTSCASVTFPPRGRWPAFASAFKAGHGLRRSAGPGRRHSPGQTWGSRGRVGFVIMAASWP